MNHIVSDIQRGLITRGHDLGATGLGGDGIDGDLGPRTLDAIHDEIGLPAPAAAQTGFALSERDERRLTGVHDNLARVIRRAAETAPLPFAVLEGLRSRDRQRQLVATGASKTMNSRHLTGHAVDIAPLGDNGQISWDWPLYHKLAPAVKAAAAELGVAIEWGGDWRRFRDGPHWQLPWSSHPVS